MTPYVIALLIASPFIAAGFALWAYAFGKPLMFGSVK